MHLKENDYLTQMLAQKLLVFVLSRLANKGVESAVVFNAVGKQNWEEQKRVKRSDMNIPELITDQFLSACFSEFTGIENRKDLSRCLRDLSYGNTKLQLPLYTVWVWTIKEEFRYKVF